VSTLYLGPPCRAGVGRSLCGSTVYRMRGDVPPFCPCISLDGPSHRHLLCDTCGQNLTLELREYQRVITRDVAPEDKEAPCRPVKSKSPPLPQPVR
jgi:hypothetical protein